MKKVMSLFMGSMLVVSMVGVNVQAETLPNSEKNIEVENVENNNEAVVPQSSLNEDVQGITQLALGDTEKLEKLSTKAEETFSESGVRYVVVGEGKVRITETNGFVSQSSDPDVMQIDSVEHDGKTYLVTQLGHISGSSTFKTLVMNNVDSFSALDSSFGNNVAIKGVFPSITNLDRSAMYKLRGAFDSLEMTGLTSLPESTFSDSYKLKEVSLPNVTVVGEYAFAKTPLEKVNMPKLKKISATMFQDCNNLKEINLPSVTEVEELGLFRTPNLETVILQNCKTVGKNGFRDLANLKNVTMPNVEYIGDMAFKSSSRTNGSTNQADSNKVTQFSFPKLKEVGVEAFMNCRAVTSFSAPVLTKLPDKAMIWVGAENGFEIDTPLLSEIGKYCFEDSGLKQGNFPKLTSVPQSAFSRTAMLENLNLPEATYIGDSSVSLSGVKTVNIPKVTEIDANAFRESAKLEDVKSPSLKKVNNTAFYVHNNATSSLKSINLENVESIGTASFRYCEKLKNVELPKATSVGLVAFGNCTGMESFSAPKLVTLSERVLADNVSLKDVDIPLAETIGYKAMINCKSIETMHMGSVKTIKDNAFAVISGQGNFEKLYLDGMPPVVEATDTTTTQAFLNQKTPRYVYVKDVEAYKAVDDGNTNDNLWYGWIITQTHKINTEVVNGSISASITEVNSGESRKITYSPNEGYILDYITVDGENVDITKYPNSYTFENIDKDHTIKVVYKKKPADIIEPEEPTTPPQIDEDVTEEPTNPPYTDGDKNESTEDSSNPVKTGDVITGLPYIVGIGASLLGVGLIGKKRKK